MRRVIFLFLDGVGLGPDDSTVNPLAGGDLPTLTRLLEGQRPTARVGRLSTEQAELIPADAQMGVPGRPQSATGQAAILTGINAPARLGRHYGPWPDRRVRAILDEGGIFARLNRETAGRAYFCNAYPQRYFDAVNRGKRLLSAVPYAAVQGGQPLADVEALQAGRALSADFTGEGWRQELGYPDAPLYTPQEAGRQLWRLAQEHAFVFFEHWLTDILGHRQDLAGAVADLERFDGFLAGLLEAADLAETLILVASDHGNVEECDHGKHTENPALTLLLGASRRELAPRIRGLDDLVPAILAFLDGQAG